MFLLVFGGREIFSEYWNSLSMLIKTIDALNRHARAQQSVNHGEPGIHARKYDRVDGQRDIWLSWFDSCAASGDIASRMFEAVRLTRLEIVWRT